MPGGRAALEKRWQLDQRGGQGLSARAASAGPLGAGRRSGEWHVNAVVMLASDDPRRLSRARAADTLEFCAWPAVSLLFHRHDVAVAKRESVLKVDAADVFDPLFRGGVPRELARLGKTGIGFGQGSNVEQLRQVAASQIKHGIASVNSGMALAPGRNRLADAGSSPVLVEPIIGRLGLRGLTGGGHAKVYALGPNGERDHSVEVAESAGSLSFGLSAQHRSMHYEIVRE